LRCEDLRYLKWRVKNSDTEIVCHISETKLSHAPLSVYELKTKKYIEEGMNVKQEFDEKKK